MPRWKWFQRKTESVDVVQQPIYGNQGGAYGSQPDLNPEWNTPTRVIPRDRPLLTRAAEWRASHAVRDDRA